MNYESQIFSLKMRLQSAERQIAELQEAIGGSVRWLTVKEAAALAGVSNSAMYERVANHKVKSKKVGGTILIDESSIY